ncbi:hypothetical protein HMPREF6485_1108 [Segatella buccae ATCC 33574]|uniref:Uncharacterized protein n=2 Tax=Segatella buccae TaxID=28126 RepID=E6K672_9BACT|nr:hypothetical protein HMPREF6485_1108 [Segatella buccae ATCC 33574]
MVKLCCKTVSASLSSGPDDFPSVALSLCRSALMEFESHFSRHGKPLGWRFILSAVPLCVRYFQIL